MVFLMMRPLIVNALLCDAHCASLCCTAPVLQVGPADEAALRAGLSRWFPAAAGGRMLAASTCMFTNTPDGHFVIDAHPRHPQVV